MSRRVYVSCEANEAEAPEVRELCDYAGRHGCVLYFPPKPGWSFYRVIEDLVDPCDSFVAVVGAGLAGSTWLNHVLHYAAALRKYRNHPRPRLLALPVGGHEIPPCSSHIEVEWLGPGGNGFDAVLHDLPPR